MHQALFFNLDLLKRTLGLHSCVLLLADESGQKLRIVELTTDSDDIAEGPFPVGAGAVGAAYQRGLTMNLEHLKPGLRGHLLLPRPVAGAGVHRGAGARGRRSCAACCAPTASTTGRSRAADEDALAHAITHLLRALENERVFVQLERSKREHAVLRRASQALGAALTEQARARGGALRRRRDRALRLRRGHALRRRRRACTACARRSATAPRTIANLSFRDNTSLTAMAVKNRHYLPYRGEFDPGSQVVYTRKASLARHAVAADPAAAWCASSRSARLALAARRRDAFGAQVRPTLAVLANQLAVALSERGLGAQARGAGDDRRADRLLQQARLPRAAARRS